MLLRRFASRVSVPCCITLLRHGLTHWEQQSRFNNWKTFMPLLLEHIDAIARQKQRGVLYVEFHPLAIDPEAGEDLSERDIMAWKTMSDSAWQLLPIRQQLIEWLDARGIGWQRCGHYAQIGLMMGYRGQIYIDLPFYTTLPAFQALQAFLENPDGTMRF